MVKYMSEEVCTRPVDGGGGAAVEEELRQQGRVAGSVSGLGVAVSFPAVLALHSERQQSCGGGWRVAGGCLGGEAGGGRRLGGCLGGVGGGAASNKGFEPRFCHDFDVPDEKPAPFDEGEGVANCAVFRIWLDLVHWMPLNRMSKRDCCHSSSTEMSVSVKLGTRI